MIERVAFEQKQFYDMIGKEFLVTALGIKKISSPNFNGIEGFLAEIISRKPHSCENYSLGNIKTIVLDDDIKLATYINEVLSTYIFVLKEPIINGNMPAILKGSLSQYNLHNNTIDSSVMNNARIYLSAVPKSKTKSQLACL